MHWETVGDLLAETLRKLMQAEELMEFRLVGGTALSLHLGHRMSVDIDLFTDAIYGSIDFDLIEAYLLNNFAYVHGDFGGGTIMGKSYLVGSDKDNGVKLDVYYSNDPFFQDVIEVEGIRMATVQEIIAMKIDIVQRNRRKKDFWDLHDLLLNYTIDQMIDLHKQRFEWTHEPDLIIGGFGKISEADDDLTPICLKNKQWAFIKDDFREAIKDHEPAGT
ncbi:MAG: nucleotidyl transferase AbiEii/AbiGii toxin family protein [Mucilaginibacter sp.]